MCLHAHAMIPMKRTVIQFRSDFLLGLVIGNHDNNEVGQGIVY